MGKAVEAFLGAAAQRFRVYAERLAQSFGHVDRHEPPAWLPDRSGAAQRTQKCRADGRSAVHVASGPRGSQTAGDSVGVSAKV